MIELKHVTCAYGEKTPIRDLTLALPDAGVIAVFGASGSGQDDAAASVGGTNPTCIRHGGRALRKARFHGVSGGPPSALEDSA